MKIHCYIISYKPFDINKAAVVLATAISQVESKNQFTVNNTDLTLLSKFFYSSNDYEAKFFAMSVLNKNGAKEFLPIAENILECDENIATINDKKTNYQASGMRTLLFDELLTNDDTLEGRAMIGRFKNFIENISQKYHTTVLMKTNKDLGDFEEASIGDQRFDLKIKINNRTATPQVREKYKVAKKEFDRLINNSPAGVRTYTDDEPAFSYSDHWNMEIQT